MQIKFPYFTLMLLISFASVNAVLFTPALPNIAHFFRIGEDTAQHTITWFLAQPMGAGLAFCFDES